jgi:SAM-dependent methyltransferase
MMDEAMELNRRRWDEATGIHARGDVYGLEHFRAGGCRLHRIELEELGEVRGKSLLHLQCHFGLDTLSWARRGATVTGVDFSPKAIELARRTASEAKIDARFIETDLYDLPDVLNEQFDIVFTSYGALNWLNDINRWGQIVARYLKPGGTFYIVEAHPFATVFPIDEDIKDGSTRLHPMIPYFFDPKGIHWPANPDYADPTVSYTVGTCEWHHTMSGIVNALISAGLRIEFLHEFPFCAWAVTAFCQTVEDRGNGQTYFGLPASYPSLPLMFSIKATKMG